ncbi:MAG: ATP-binding cassette domain-containing protein [Smithellaceae bacterium]|nr:ATP-binding cassette domain-containing protein [Syntrophaceae bacterium]MDD4241027.1 ATP-binding cassette domain-containing protein [Smithellaceae bacterium]NLX53060.1 ATP-binding cassette domain-containing protein [Deltaproteobacteria bacterium]
MLELKNIYFTIPESEEREGGRRNIINGIDYVFEKGKFYAITGPNGSGKTTLAKLIMGIYPLSQGTILFKGQDISPLSITERAKAGIAYSFQQPARFKGITFRDLLTIATGVDDERKLLEILGRVGICPLSFLDKEVDARLSGGEIKKIELATTIAANPALAIYDEPDTGIDLWTIGPMVSLLKKELAERQTTTIVVSHNRAFLEAADVVMIINSGRIVYDGNLEGAMPLLDDLSVCTYRDSCEGERDAGCYR